MAQTTLSVRMDETLKKGLEAFCADVGMNTSVAINMFAKSRLARAPLAVRCRVLQPRPILQPGEPRPLDQSERAHGAKRRNPSMSRSRTRHDQSLGR